MAASTTANASLIFRDFLAMPLLDLGGENIKERKFSGNEEIALNIDPLGRVIDAYVHHALVDSLGDILLVDVQGRSLQGFLPNSLSLLASVGIVFEDSHGGLCLFDPQAHTFVLLIKCACSAG